MASARLSFWPSAGRHIPELLRAAVRDAGRGLLFWRFVNSRASPSVSQLRVFGRRAEMVGREAQVEQVGILKAAR